MNTKKNIKKEKNIQLPNISPVMRPLDISQSAAYGIFLSVSFLMTVLLYGASLRAGGQPVAMMHMPDPHAALRQHIGTMVDGYPIERMSASIAKRDKTTAAFLVGIAKKESNWGKRVPVDAEGKDCFNYWGYRGAGSRGTAMGHGCFGSPEEAVRVVGNRIDTFVHDYKFDTPEQLIVWKCGWNCDAHSSQSVKKWIADVGYYYRKVKD